jgi:dTDP-4-dehydrorhamnose reductase
MGRPPSHPALEAPGWWRREDRLLYRGGTAPRRAKGIDVRKRRELLITGARGTLGKAFARLCEQRGLACRLVDRQTLDIADAASVKAALETFAPWAVVNAAGYCRVDEAERDRGLCYRENALGPALLARACAARGVPLVTFSSDLVFDGRSRSPYRESDEVAPLCVYGLSKADAERDVLAAHAGALVVRTSAFFGPWDEYNFVTLTLRALARGEHVFAAEDLTVSPTYVPDLADASLDLLIDGANGIWHLANAGATTWADLAARTAQLRGYDAGRVVAVPCASLGFTARRPAYSALASERGSGVMPPLETALERYARECVLA